LIFLFLVVCLLLVDLLLLGSGSGESAPEKVLRSLNWEWR